MEVGKKCYFMNGLGGGNNENLNHLIIDDLVKSLKRRISVIPANPGSSPGQAPESSSFNSLQISWTPVFTGVTTFYEFIKFGDGSIEYPKALPTIYPGWIWGIVWPVTG